MLIDGQISRGLRLLRETNRNGGKLAVLTCIVAVCVNACSQDCRDG